MTKELKKRRVLLHALVQLGGQGTKAEVLDFIDKKRLLNLTSADRAIMSNRDEPVWRNDLAFIRHHLVLEGFIDGSARNRWKITPTGRRYLETLPNPGA